MKTMEPEAVDIVGWYHAMKANLAQAQATIAALGAEVEGLRAAYGRAVVALATIMQDQDERRDDGVCVTCEMDEREDGYYHAPDCAASAVLIDPTGAQAAEQWRQRGEALERAASTLRACGIRLDLPAESQHVPNLREALRLARPLIVHGHNSSCVESCEVEVAIGAIDKALADPALPGEEGR